MIKDTHRSKAPSNKTPALTKSMNMDTWVVVASNQLFLRGSYAETNFQENEAATSKTLLFVMGQFCMTHSIYFNNGF